MFLTFKRSEEQKSFLYKKKVYVNQSLNIETTSKKLTHCSRAAEVSH